MRRYGLGILAIASLLIGTLAAMGHFRELTAYHATPTQFTLIGANRGTIVFSDFAWKSPTIIPIYPPDRHFHFGPGRLSLGMSLWGFRHSSTDGSAASGHVTTMPIWCLLLPCSIAPILWVKKRRRLKARGFPVEPQDGSSTNNTNLHESNSTPPIRADS